MLYKKKKMTDIKSQYKIIIQNYTLLEVLTNFEIFYETFKKSKILNLKKIFQNQ